MPFDDLPPSGATPSKPAQRVAVIVVHGVADQAPGATTRAFVDLMVAAGGRDGATYASLATEAYTLAVPLPEPIAGDAGTNPSAPVRAELSGEPAAEAGPPDVLKSLRQSGVSDFHHYGLDKDANIDSGLAFTDYLVRKAHRHRMPQETYASERQSLLRHAKGGTTLQVDVHELYWADLSRLSGSAPRIVTEMFTLIFRLSRLARDTVERASAGGGRLWGLLRRAQTGVDWLFTHVLAQLFALLLCVGLYLVGAGLLTREPPQFERVIQGFAWALLGAGALALFYFGRPAAPGERASPWALGAAIAAVAVAGLLYWQPHWSAPPVLVALLAAAYLAGLRAGNRRFPFVWHSGLTLLLAVLAFVAVHMLWGQDRPADRWTPRDVWLDAGMIALEAVLNAVKISWILLAGLILCWAVLSLGLSTVAWARNDQARRASAATGRLGMLVSMTVLLVVTMALWSAIHWAVRQPLANHMYTAVVWTPNEAAAAAGSSAVPAQAATTCPDGPEPKDLASAAFVDCRFKGTTQTFAVIVTLLLALGLYLVATLLPSLMVELRLTHSTGQARARRLGTWLTACYRWLDSIVALITVMAALAAIAVVAWWLAEPLGYRLPFHERWRGFAADLQATSNDWLAPLTITATGALAAFSILGRLLSRMLPGLRAPLDAALDVDNYMREFPRTAIPRVRMLARALALLEHVRRGGYDRVVFVAHSQGTVLVCETLRRLSSESLKRKQSGRTERLHQFMRCQSVRLLTLGSPLRQLYAARFPVLYAWVLANHPDPAHPANPQAYRNGPRAEDIGVERWANAFGSGDYVGRWLWARSVAATRKYHPLIDELPGDRDSNLGRETAYDVFDPKHGQAKQQLSRAEFETCVGHDAHTHYFDPPGAAGEIQVVAALADDLIALP